MIWVMRGRFGVPVAAALAAGVLVGSVLVAPLSTPAGAQQSLIDSDPAVVKARAEVEQAQLAAHQAAAELEQTTEQSDDLQRQITDHETHVAALEQQRTELAAIRDALHEHLRTRARALYTANAGGTGLAELFSGSAIEGMRRQSLGDAAARTDAANAKKLLDARDQLSAVQDSLRHEQSDLQSQHDTLTGVLDRLQQQQAVVDQRVAEANAALARARVIGALHAAGEPIMGPSALDADQIAAWYHSKSYSPHLPAGVTVDDLIPIFLQEGADENVRGDVAFAQSIVETGGFSSAPDNNYSGLGWCDGCARGTTFPTPRDGIRAQIQLLLNYANPDSRVANLHHPPSPYWWDSDPVKAARYFDTYFAKGWAPTWSDMGHGNWATAPNYSSAVLNVYHQMEAFSQK
jgi:peptidoglycan hydrolase CwlO-like protein